MTPLRSEEHVQAWAAENGAMVEDIQALADPGADQLLGWDESANAAIGFTTTDGIEFSTTTIRLASTVGGNGLAFSSGVLSFTDATAGAANPVVITDGAVTFDLSSITEIVAQGVDQAADGYLVNDAGALKVVPYDQNGIIVTTGTAAKTFAITDANTMSILTGTTERVWTIPANAAVAFEVGTVIICKNNSTTQDIVITADTGVALVSKFHLSGTADSDNIVPGGTAALIKMATDQWSLAGDIETS